MSDEEIIVVVQEPADPTPPETGLYASAGEAIKKVASEFEYWSGRLTDTSLQLGYAVIAADWVIFASGTAGVNGILANPWAKWSVLFVILALASNIVAAWVMSESHRKRVEYAESNTRRWEIEFAQNARIRSAWPFTDFTERFGRYMRILKASLTLAAGALLVIGAMLTTSRPR